MLQVFAKRRVEGAAHGVVVARQHAVLAVIPAQLGEKGHWLLGALVDEFAVDPVQGVGECGPLRVEVGGKQVAH